MKNNVNGLSVALMCSGTIIISSTAFAAQNGDIKWSGFASASASQVSGGIEEYRRRFENGKTEYSNTRIGLNISAKISDDISVAGQILMAGREDEYAAHADWVFITYSPHQLKNTAFKLGRIKFATLLNSEVYDVGYAYPWVSVPSEIYDFTASGSQATYEVMSGANVSYGSYIGDFDWKIQAFVGEADSGLGTVDSLIGSVLAVNNDDLEFRLGYHQGTLVEDDGEPAGGLVGKLGELKEEELVGADKEVTNLGVIWNISNLRISAEYVSVDWSGGREAEQTDLFDTNSYYVSAGYRMGDWMPMLTLAEMDEEGGTNQESITLGVRYELSRSTAVKLEWQSIDIAGRAEPLYVENEQGDKFFQSGLAILAEDGVEDKLTMINFSIDVVF